MTQLHKYVIQYLLTWICKKQFNIFGKLPTDLNASNCFENRAVKISMSQLLECVNMFVQLLTDLDTFKCFENRAAKIYASKTLYNLF